MQDGSRPGRIAEEGTPTMPERTGYIQVYTGNGKGKTTAAFGLALRAVGVGHTVLVAQFAKATQCGELGAFERLGDQVELRRYGSGCFIRGNPTEEDIAAARNGLVESTEALASGMYDLVILDEANIAVYYEMFSVEELLAAMSARAQHVEVVVTGRHAHKKLIAAADLVTEMKMVKHYYDQGVQARVGIEK